MLETGQFWTRVIVSAFLLLAGAVSQADDPTAYLGVQLEEETEYPEGGARITEVVDDSPASEAGFVAGDIIVDFDGHTIRGPVGLTQKIHAKKPSDPVSIRFVRDGRKRTVEVELGRRSNLFKPFVMPEIELPPLG